jgi:hypothetical protein
MGSHGGFTIVASGRSTPPPRRGMPPSVRAQQSVQGDHQRFGTDILSLFNCHRDGEEAEREDDRWRFQNRLKALGIKYKSLYVGIDGTSCLNLSGTIITDLSPLRELPLTHLCLQGCYGIADFSPLGDMSLTWLNLCRTKITDLTSLAGLSLSHLDLHRTRTTDLRPLKGVPLRSLDIRFTWITDVSPLGRMPLEELSFYPSRIACGLDPLRGVGSLATINRRPAEAFWRQHG